MAENFVIPKAFTREWYEYVWDYYKFHIIAVAAAIILIASVIITVVTTVRYDTKINIVISGTIEAEKTDMLAIKCAEISKDLNENGRVDIGVNQLNFTEENMESGEIHSALVNKLLALFSSNEELIYITDSYTIERIKQMKNTDSVFYPSNEWADETYDKKGDFGVSLKESAILKELNIDGSDLYVMIAKSDTEPGFKPEEENAIKIAKFLLK